jgi:hypothetical protein
VSTSQGSPHLEEQADAWHQTKRLTEYVTAVRDHATSLPPGQEKTEIEAWLAFADARLQHLEIFNGAGYDGS